MARGIIYRDSLINGRTRRRSIQVPRAYIACKNKAESSAFQGVARFFFVHARGPIFRGFCDGPIDCRASSSLRAHHWVINSFLARHRHSVSPIRAGTRALRAFAPSSRSLCACKRAVGGYEIKEILSGRAARQPRCAFIIVKVALCFVNNIERARARAASSLKRVAPTLCVFPLMSRGAHHVGGSVASLCTPVRTLLLWLLCCSAGLGINKTCVLIFPLFAAASVGWERRGRIESGENLCARRASLEFVRCIFIKRSVFDLIRGLWRDRCNWNGDGEKWGLLKNIWKRQGAGKFSMLVPFSRTQSDLVRHGLKDYMFVEICIYTKGHLYFASNLCIIWKKILPLIPVCLLVFSIYGFSHDSTPNAFSVLPSEPLQESV